MAKTLIKSRIILFVATLLTGWVLFNALNPPAYAATPADSGIRVYDYASLLSEEETAELEARILTAREDINMDIVFLTSNDTQGKDSQAYADDFYDENGFGTGDFKAGVLYFIDMDHRVPTITTTGEMIDYINDERLESIFNAVDPYLQEEDWYGSAGALIDEVTYWVAAGLPKGGYRYDSDTGQRVDEYGNPLENEARRLTLAEILIALAIGALAGLIRYISVSRKYKMKASPYAFNLQTNAVLHVVDQLDDFVRTTTTRTRINSDSGGGHGGGSGVHRGSSGTSHGGGSGRRF